MFSVPRNVYVELQRHFDREEEHRNRAAIRIARSLNLPLLATGGVSYATPYEREMLDIFTCIRHRTTLDTAGRLLSAMQSGICTRQRRCTSFSTTIPRPSPILANCRRVCNSI